MSTIARERTALSFTRAQAEDFLIHEARLLDDLKLEEWNALFTADGHYWIPLDDREPIATSASIMNDTPLRREERVHHLLHNKFPAQSPRSRTLHFISNVGVTIPGGAQDGTHDGVVVVRSSQIVYEMRTGDHKQVGLGVPQAIVADVEHQLRPVDGQMRIARKKILLLNRDSWLGNLTFLM